MNNRRMIIKNPYQGIFKKVLCVCSAGLLRSPTAARVLAEKFDCNTRAVGVDTDFALLPIDDVIVDWADEIVCMTQQHEKKIIKTFQPDVPVVCLNIPDEFEYMSPTLVSMIEGAYGEWLQKE